MNILKIGLSLMIAMIFTACVKDEIVEDSFYGKWEITDATGFLAELNLGTIYEFRENGTVTLDGLGLSSSGTFVKTVDELVITISGIDLVYLYTISGKIMVMDNLTTDQIFTLEKKR